MSLPPRLGAIGFVNALPVMMGFEWPRSLVGGQLVMAAPSVLNRALLSGELDASPVSSACYLRHQTDLLLIPGLSVSSPGAVESVLFISRHPIEAGTSLPHVIPVPDDSETSIALLRQLLRERAGCDLDARMRVYPAADYAEVLQEFGCALIIGDRALSASETSFAQAPWHVCDLSSWWKRRTGLPFVFAVWAARRDFARQQPQACEAIAQALRTSRDAFFRDEALFEQGVALASKRIGLPPTRIRHYYRRSLTYDLMDAHYQALTRFADWIGAETGPFLTLTDACARCYDAAGV